MSIYNPDKWVLVKITLRESDKSIYKIFATWLGGYLSGESWKLNSGIKEVNKGHRYFIVTGPTDSVYICPKDSYGTSSYTYSVLDNLQKQCEPKFTVESLGEEEAYKYLDNFFNGIELKG